MITEHADIHEIAERKCGLRERQRHAREDAILDAAHALIAEIGYDAMTMDDLAERAGISKPTLYHHFSSKEAIAVRAVIVRVEGSLRFIREIDPSLPAVARFEHAARALITKRLTRGSAHVLKTTPALMPVLKENGEYQETVRRFIAALCAIVEAAQKEGSITPAIPARLAVQTLVSLLRDHDYEEMTAAAEFTADEITETLVSLLMRGIRR